MKKEGLSIASYPLTKEALAPINIWGFKLNETFMDLLLSIQVIETPNRKYPGYLAGRTALKAVVSHHPKEVIQFHANLEVIKKNQNYWFYTYTPIEFEMAAAYINEWLRKECRAKNLSYTPTKWQDWGHFEELSLSDFLDQSQFRNGHGVLERYFLLQLTKQPLSFVKETTLQLYPVISEGKNTIMTAPYFNEGVGPFSFAVTATINQFPNDHHRLLEFNTQVKLWVQENPITKKYKYFDSNDSTSVYLYNPELTDDPSFIVFNQMSLKLKKDELILNHKADQYYCEQNDIQLAHLLDKELHSFDLNPTSLRCQTLLTVPNDVRGDCQTLKDKKKPVSHAGYGLGLPERECFMDNISAILKPFKIEPQEIMPKLSKNILKPDKDMDKKLMYEEYGLEALYEKGTKMKVRKQPYYHSKDEITIGYATTSKLMETALKGFVRLLLRADQKVDENVYINSNGIKVHFVELPMALSEAFSEKPLSSEIGRRAQLVKKVSTNLDGAFIEIEAMKNQKKDSKHFLRTEFAKEGIPLQFFYPSVDSDKADICNRSQACAQDLLFKMGFIEAELQTVFKSNPEKIILSISRINIKNKVKIPCLTKTTQGGSWIKVYPEKEWVRIEKLSKQFSSSYVDHNDSLWDKKNGENHYPLAQQWLKDALKEFEKTLDLLVYWDEAIESLLPFFDLSDFDQFLEKFTPLDLSQTRFIRWKNASQSPTYMTYKKSGSGIEISKTTGVFQSPVSNRSYYLIGDRGDNQQTVKAALRLENPSGLLTSIGMPQCHISPEIPKEEALQLMVFTQELRRMVLTQNTSAAEPYPLYLKRFLNEQIESLVIRYAKEKPKKSTD